MNRNEFLSVVVISLSSACTNTFDNFSLSETSKTTIKTNRVCDNCKYNLGRNIAFEKGVQDAVIDVKNRTITITYNPEKTSVENLKNYVVSLGFDANEMKANIYKREGLRDCCLMDITICK